VRRTVLAVPGAPLTIEREDGPDVIALHVSGEVDVATSSKLEDALERAVLTGRDVVVDLTDVSFFAAAGVRVLTHAAERDGARLAVLASPSVRRVLDLLPDVAEIRALTVATVDRDPRDRRGPRARLDAADAAPAQGF
jgi:anti-anti-sigma factor